MRLDEIGDHRQQLIERGADPFGDLLVMRDRRRPRRRGLRVRHGRRKNYGCFFRHVSSFG
jgi:hypothetical protein